jgi:hypothetical protein
MQVKRLFVPSAEQPKAHRSLLIRARHKAPRKAHRPLPLLQAPRNTPQQESKKTSLVCSVTFSDGSPAWFFF